jgi:cyanophycinase
MRKVLLAFIFLLCAGVYSHAQNIGPANGKLLIVGGGDTKEISPVFIELAGGAESKIVVIPTALEEENFDEDFGFIRELKNAGAINITILHTRDRQVANTNEFIRPLQVADAVWFVGGRQWRLVDAYEGTKVVDELWKLLDRGGIIGGTSAGATIQGSYLARGDSKTNTIMMGDHQAGFGFLKNTAIDQHVLVRNRMFDMFEILDSHPKLLGFGIDESTALLVEKDTAEVVGKSYVAVYDGTVFNRETRSIAPISRKGRKFYFIRKGDKYDLKNRKVILPERNGQ